MSKADVLKAKIGLSGPPLERLDNAPPNIPDHEMVRRIGSGSYGEVWLARNAVGTWRAVKVVYRAHFKDERPYEREFTGIQKYEPISRTNEGLVDVLQIVRNDAEGYFYYVMELADDAGLESRLQAASGSMDSDSPTANLPPTDRLKAGLQASYTPKTLASEIRARGRLPFEECITLGLTLNLSLGHLHRSGLIHRDIKPSNIIFVNGVAKLADIGLVTDLADAQSFVGTEGFIPPEGPNSPQADIYALGKVLYEASMGKDRQEFPEPFSHLGLDADSRSLMELNAVLLRACAPNPKQRYQSAEEMNVDLALLHSGKSVKDKHTLERRLKITTRVAVAVVALMVLGVVPYYLAIKEARRATAAAKSESEHRKRAESEAAKSQQVARFLEEMLQGVGPSVALGRDTQLLNEILEKTAQRIGKDLRGQPDVEAELRSSIGDVYLELSEFEKAEAMHREALAIRLRLWGNGHLAVAASYSSLGLVLAARGNMADAETLQKEAVSTFKKLRGNEHLDLAYPLKRLGKVLSEQGKWAEAETYVCEALTIQRKLLGNEHLDVAASLDQLTEVYIFTDKLADAEAAGKEALAIRRLCKESRLVADSLITLFIILGQRPDMVTEMLEIRKELLKDLHPDAGVTLHKLAVYLWRVGKREESARVHEDALAMDRKLLGNEDPRVANSLQIMAIHRTSENNLPEAESMHREALAIYRKHWPNGVERWKRNAEQLVDVLGRENKLSDAERLLNDVLTPAIQSQAQSANLLRSRANLFARRGEWAGAAVDLAKAIEFGDQFAYFDLAAIWTALGETNAYRKHYLQIVNCLKGVTEPTMTSWMASSCLILPSSDADPTIINEWADTAVEVSTNYLHYEYLPVFQACKGLAEYRQGHFASAVDWMQKTFTNRWNYGDIHRRITAYMVMAMAQWQMNQREQARRTLSDGLQLAEEKLPRLESGDLGETWRDWIIVQALMKEAKALIEGGAETNGESKRGNHLALPASPSSAQKD